MKHAAAIVLALVLLATAGFACAEATITEKDQLNQSGMKVGVGTGSASVLIAENELPNAELVFLDDNATAYEAVAQGKLDAYIYERSQMQLAIDTGLSGVHLLDQDMDEQVHIGVGISPKCAIPDFQNQLNAFIAQIKADGTFDEMYQRWMMRREETMPEIDVPEGARYHLVVGTTGVVPPYSYYVGTELNGFDIELARRFAAWIGADLSFKVYDYGAIIPAAASGDVDCIMANLNVTPERAEALPFSDDLFTEPVGILVRGDAPAAAESASESFTSLDQLDGKRIGVQTGTTAADITLARLPNAQISYFSTFPDMAVALKTHKIDGFPGDGLVLAQMALEDPSLVVLDERLRSYDCGFVLPKTEQGEALCEEINAWIAEMRASGELDRILKKWTERPEEERTVPDYSSLPAPKGVLTMTTEGTFPPMNYYRGEACVGMEIELCALFCEANGYGLNVTTMDFDGMLAAVQAGKVDFAISGIAITDERKQSVLFSDPYYTGGTRMAVLRGDADAQPSLEQLNGKRCAVQTGTISGEAAQSVLPDIILDYYNTQADCLAALRTQKADFWATDEPVARYMLTGNGDLKIVGSFDRSSLAAVFPKTDAGQALCEQYSAFVDELWESGAMAEIDSVWFGTDEDAKVVPDYDALPDTNGTLRMAADTTLPPFAYVKDNRPLGYDVDIAARFCAANGYRLEVVPMDFAGVLSSVQTGKCDFAACAITITEERAESVLFSSPTYRSGTVAVVSTAAAAEAASKTPEYQSFSDLAGKRVSMLNGAPFEELVRSRVPDVGEFSYYSTMTDLMLALRSKKTDAILMNNAVSQLAVNRNPDFTLFPQSLQDGVFGLAFAKGDPQRDIWQAAFDSIPQEAIQAAWEKWTGADESAKIMPEQDWPGSNGTVKVAACDTLEPMSYAGEGGELKGFDLEIVLMMARELDVRVEFVGMEFSAVLSCVQSGKALIGAGSIIATDERRESVDFIDYQPAAFVLVVRAKAEAEAKPGFLDEVKSSFNKTFLREERWRLFVRGVLTTLLITLLSILFGTLLGFCVFMLCRNGNPAANLVTRFCLWLVQGMPMVVLLMILYYIIFGSVSISGVAVAVVGFTLTFGSAVFGLLKMGVGAVDNGQYEAAYALGYSNRRTFFKIILPQALPHVLPAYKGEIVGLIKATAIVGYIAVQDLTKMGDIVRSRTYEAFFPLIAVTIIYFVLEGLIKLMLSGATWPLDPRHRRTENILKGVKTDDQD